MAVLDDLHGGSVVRGVLPLEGEQGHGHRRRAVRRLTRSTLAGHALPDGRVGIVHLGLGAFHRAHQAVLTQRAMLAAGGDWSICAVAQRSTASGTRLRPQDNLFTVAERDAAGERLTVVGSIREVLLATRATGPAHRAAVRRGHPHRDDHGDRGRPTVPDGAGGGTAGPRAAGPSRARRGLTVISCDNLPDNGRLLARLVRDASEPALWDWVAAPRHVPVQCGRPDRAGDHRRRPACGRGRVRADRPRRGGRRAVPAVGDRGPVRRPAPGVGAGRRRFVVRHRAAPEGQAAAGQRHALGARVPRHARRLRDDGGGRRPCRSSPPSWCGWCAGDRSQVSNANPEALLARFANPRITHRLAQIAADGPHKLPQRLLAPAAEIIAAGGEPRLICLALAGFLRHQGLSTLDFLPVALRESAVFQDLMTDALARLDVATACSRH